MEPEFTGSPAQWRLVSAVAVTIRITMWRKTGLSYSGNSSVRQSLEATLIPWNYRLATLSTFWWAVVPMEGSLVLA